MATTPPILVWQPGGGVPVGPVSNPPVYSQHGTTQLVEGQAYVDVVFGSTQTTDEWVLVECVVVNEIDVEPLNIWPGIITDKTAAGFRLQLNGLPDSSNYYLHWAVSGVNIAPTPATNYTLVGPSSGPISAASANFTVALPPSTTFSGSLTVTPNDGGGGGTFAPANVVLSTATASATFTYTPASYGAKTISTTNSGTLTNPTGIVFSPLANTYTLSGPSSGTTGSASTNFTVALPVGGVVVGTVTVTPHDGSDGAFTPTTVGLTTAAPSATFTYTPASTGSKTISVTNNGGLTNPGNLTYTVSAPVPIVLDTFTDTNGTTLPSHTMDTGTGWTEFDGSPGNHCTIQSNKCISFPDPSNAYGYQTESSDADCTVQVTAVFGVADSGHYCMLVFRYSDATNYWMLRVNGSGTSNVELVKKVAGVEAVVSTTSLAITAGVGVLLKAILSGTSISVSAGAANLSTTDSFNQTATKHGIRMYEGSGATRNTFEDFTVMP